ncbi:MAG: cobalamin biosynthesis protein [Clostridia bacterium]|nr:cobalamin biosynthesis protein [Clostridia bacterium]
MQIRIISYTAKGEETAQRAADALTAGGHACRTFALEKFCKPGDETLSVSASEWAREAFETSDALIFVCAAGIAVRAIAPWVKSKTTDPAVLVLDETGRFAIPLLSGHIGGANELALALSAALGATPVVTTATDLNDLFAVDVFATKNRLAITDMALAKEISAALLMGEPVGFCSDLPVSGPLPRGLTDGEAALGVCVSREQKTPYPKTLRLIPKRFALGVGCKKGRDAEALDAFIRRRLIASGVPIDALFCMASIDLKRDEPGLLAFSEAHRLPFYTYSADELNAVPGTFSGSAFVKETTGTDCVSERAAVKASGGELIVKKIAEDGMTFALAESKEGISFA